MSKSPCIRINQSPTEGYALQRHKRCAPDLTGGLLHSLGYPIESMSHILWNWQAPPRILTRKLIPHACNVPAEVDVVSHQSGCSREVKVDGLFLANPSMEVSFDPQPQARHLVVTIFIGCPRIRNMCFGVRTGTPPAVPIELIPSVEQSVVGEEQRPVRGNILLERPGAGMPRSLVHLAPARLWDSQQCEARERGYVGPRLLSGSVHSTVRGCYDEGDMSQSINHFHDAYL